MCAIASSAVDISGSKKESLKPGSGAGVPSNTTTFSISTSTKRYASSSRRINLPNSKQKKYMQQIMHTCNTFNL